MRHEDKEAPEPRPRAAHWAVIAAPYATTLLACAGGFTHGVALAQRPYFKPEDTIVHGLALVGWMSVILLGPVLLSYLFLRFRIDEKLAHRLRKAIQALTWAIKRRSIRLKEKQNLSGTSRYWQGFHKPEGKSDVD